MIYTHNDFKYIDIHTHFFPPNIFDAIWKVFEMPDYTGHIRGWSINYKLPINELIELFEEHNVEAFTTLNYAHKRGVAEYFNDWTVKFVKKQKNAIPFGCVHPEDKNRVAYIRELFDTYNFTGIKVQPLVQNFHVADKRMNEIYELIVDKGKWLLVHAGTAPYRNEYVGFKYFKEFINKFPDINVIVAHMGAFEYRKFFKLTESHENLYFDTAMIYIPQNVFRERIVRRPDAEELLSYQDRILYGSDFPNIPYEYERSTKGFFKLALPKAFYKKIFYENAKKLFKL
ncbi:MAG: amidohydrolase family protein [Promethearchaeota archaeon]